MDDRLTVEESIAIVMRAKHLEFDHKRLLAQLDGWRTIARELLTIAFDGDVSANDDIPPLEIIELRAAGKLPDSFVPALQQFWADLTRKHEERRAARSRANAEHDALELEDVEYRQLAREARAPFGTPVQPMQPSARGGKKLARRIERQQQAALGRRGRR